MLDGLDDAAVAGAGDGHQVLAHPLKGLVVRAEDARVVGGLEAHNLDEQAVVAELERVEVIAIELVEREKEPVGVVVPLLRPEGDDVLDRCLPVDLRPDVLDERSARADVERLEAQADRNSVV